MTIPAVTHVRRNTGVLATVEKRTLVWLAGRLPRWVNSDHLTLLALAAMAGAAGAFWLSRVWPLALFLVPLALAVNWFGDSLDGTLARVRAHERPRYGYYVDHVVDLAGIALLTGGMMASGLLSPVVGLTFLVAYLMVAAEVFLATAAGREFRMSFLRVGPTELRIVLTAGALTAFWRPTVNPLGLGPYPLFDVGGMAAVAGLAAAFVTAAARNIRRLYVAEPLPQADGAHARLPGPVVPVGRL